MGRWVLPEGPTLLLTDVPLPWRKLRQEVHVPGYSGKPVLYLRKSNVVEEHNQEFTVKYTFNFLHLLQEPLPAGGGFPDLLRNDHSVPRAVGAGAPPSWGRQWPDYRALALTFHVGLQKLEKAVSKLEGVAKGGASEGRSGAEQAVKATADKVKEALGEVERVLGPRANVADIVSRLASLQTAALALGRGGREGERLALGQRYYVLQMVHCACCTGYSLFTAFLNIRFRSDRTWPVVFCLKTYPCIWRCRVFLIVVACAEGFGLQLRRVWIRQYFTYVLLDKIFRDRITAFLLFVPDKDCVWYS
eukprot:jgi/Botrbrau1/17894/Bobra.0477s0004.1